MSNHDQQSNDGQPSGTDAQGTGAHNEQEPPKPSPHKITWERPCAVRKSIAASTSCILLLRVLWAKSPALCRQPPKSKHRTPTPWGGAKRTSSCWSVGW
ncbi:MAG: hypothetical protein EOO78_09065 [Oxalobacteraceae bacterium]|nr:MAG: hypothetical protein EOO78_09065 [Oxalobacteraceae bacterium]